MKTLEITFLFCLKITYIIYKREERVTYFYKHGNTKRTYNRTVRDILESKYNEVYLHVTKKVYEKYEKCSLETYIILYFSFYTSSRFMNIFCNKYNPLHFYVINKTIIIVLLNYFINKIKILCVILLMK